MLTDYLRSEFIRAWIGNLVYGWSLCMAKSSVEHDKRRQAKYVRELIAAGYVREAGENSPHQVEVTSLAYDELEAEPFTLEAAWDAETSRLRMPCVIFSRLSNAQKKYALQCQLFQWHLCRKTPLFHDVPWEQGDKVGPLVLGQEVALASRGLEAAVREREKRYTTVETELVLRSPALDAHVMAKVKANRAARAYHHDLINGLFELEIAPESILSQVTASGDTGLYGRSVTNLGDDAERWEENLDGNLRRIEEKIRRYQENLNTLRSLQECIRLAGGWDKVKERLQDRAKAIAEVPPCN